MKTSAPSRRRAVLLVDMLFAIAIVGVAIAMAARLVTAIARVYRDAPAATSVMRSQAQWLRAMRDDAWQARSMDVRPTRLAFDAGDASAVVWRCDDGRVARTAGDATQHWPIARSFQWSLIGDRLGATIGDVEVNLPTPGVDARRRS